MRRNLFCLLLALSVALQTLGQSAPIGSWADYFPYGNAIAVAEGSQHVLSCTPYAVTTYAKDDNSLDRLSKVNGLSEINLTALAYDGTTSTFVVGYANGNLDLIIEPELTIVNLSDIKRASITANKSIFHIMCNNGFAYLSTGFGVVVIDLARQEVKDTWYLGPGNSYMKINGTCIGNDTLYATTENGMYRAWAGNPFLNIASAWTKDLSLPATVVNAKLKPPYYAGGKLFVTLESAVYNGDTSFVRSNNVWMQNPYFSEDLNSVWTDGNRIVLAGNTSADLFDNSFNLIEHIFQYSFGGAIRIQAALFSSYYNDYFIADAYQGFIRAANSYNSTSLRLSGPVSLSARKIAAGENYVWVAPGNVVGTIYQNTYNKDYLSHSVDYIWSNMDTVSSPLLQGGVYDVMDVKVDPNDNTHVFASSWSSYGLLEVKDNAVVARYDETNSILQQNPVFAGFCGVDGLDFDTDGNLWLANSFSSTPLVLRTADGTWKTFNCGTAMNNRILGQTLAASNGYRYITLPTNGQTGGLFVYNTNETPTDATDDSYKFLTNAEGNGGLPSADVRCVAEDLDDEIWIGTAQGLAVIYTPENIFTTGASFDAQQILITQDGNVQILLETEIITDIAIDGGNRKWVATESSGVYLFSQDGIDQIFHFTSENSRLPSNAVSDIEVNGETGEVYFATAGGIVAYRSEATDGRNKLDNVYVFPNPVEPGYTGLIAVNGLGRDSDVKFTDIAGNVVFMTKSLGGQAVWDGNNLDGTRVKPGMYLVMCSNKSGKQKVAAKLLIKE